MGGVSEGVDLSDWRGDQKKVDTLFGLLLDAYEDHSLMSASIAVSVRSCVHSLLPSSHKPLDTLP